MKILRFIVPICAVLLTAPACKKKDAAPAPSACDPQRKKVKDVVAEPGIVWFNKEEQRYAIHSSTPSTIDQQAIALVCGELPARFRQDGLRVTFSGTYRESDKKAEVAGATYYNLEVSTIDAR